MSTMRAAQVSRPGGPLELVERPTPSPPAGHVRIKVEACGICHSDALTKDGLWPGLEFPRVPGHEVIGTVDEVGQDVPVLYDRANPNLAHIDDSILPLWVFPGCMVGVMFAMFIAANIWGVRAWKRGEEMIDLM